MHKWVISGSGLVVSSNVSNDATGILGFSINESSLRNILWISVPLIEWLLLIGLSDVQKYSQAWFWHALPKLKWCFSAYFQYFSISDIVAIFDCLLAHSFRAPIYESCFQSITRVLGFAIWSLHRKDLCRFSDD